MEEIKIFNSPEFGAVRTVAIDGEPWFVGKDVAVALGYKDTVNAIKSHVDEQDKAGWQITTHFGEKQTTIINESGLYALILSSRLESAKRFKHWVTSEVLPAIRKTGGYTLTPRQQMLKETREQNIAIRKAAQLIKLANRYKGEPWEQILNAHATKELTGEFLIPLPEVQRTYSAAEIGEKLGISGNMVGRIANEHNLKTQEYGVWVLDKAGHCNKEVSSFRYFESVIPEIKGYLS